MVLAMLHRHSRSLLRLILLPALVFAVIALWAPAGSGQDARANDPVVAEKPGYRIESVAPLALADIRAPGQTFAPKHQARSFGIGADPVWLRVAVHNHDDVSHTRVLLAGATWIDRIDFFAVHDGELRAGASAGDSATHLVRPLPGLGYRFEHAFAPGETVLYLRAQSPDPLLIPVELVRPDQALARQERARYSYGFVYGFLFALLLYNFMLFLGLGQGSHRDYALYLACFLLTNLAYTGHGYAWFWPDTPLLQNYIILISMVLFAVAGLRFAGTFLNLAEQAPRVAHGFRIGSLAALVAMIILVALRRQSAAALLAFTVVLLFSLILFVLGVVALRYRYTAARYFMTAVASGIAGTLTTTLTVWGWIPYSDAGFRAVELGLLVEATLLALAVAYRVRQHDQARQHAEQLARVDALTGLLNRRALVEQGEGLLNMSRRSGAPLALIVLDLDHFKRVNDLHGHAVGDRVLIETARVLQEISRRGDLVSRWGGEEFILLLPGASLDEARPIAHRIRDELARQAVPAGDDTVSVRASFGLAALRDQESLEALIDEADQWLYQAKQEGRNRIRDPGGLPDGDPEPDAEPA
jgi:diguanylate cyclase (GGDEF)-like protein